MDGIQKQVVQVGGQMVGVPIRGKISSLLENVAESQGIPAYRPTKKKKKRGYVEGYFPEDQTRSEIMQDAYDVPDYKR